MKRYKSSFNFTQISCLVRCNSCHQPITLKSASQNRLLRRLQSHQAGLSEDIKAATPFENQDLPVSKSDILLASLGPSAKHYSPDVSGKLDISFVNPRLIAERRNRLSIRPQKLAYDRIDVLKLVISRKKSLSSYLALYIKYLDPVEQVSDGDFYPWASDKELRGHILEKFNDENLTWLQERGYGISDFTAWRWILSASRSEVAIARLKVLSDSDKYGYQAGRVPIFLILFLLRRRVINDRAFRTLLIFIWERLLEQDALNKDLTSNEVAGKLSTEAFPQLNEHLHFHRGSITVLLIRLLRHARRVWSAALPSISTIATRYLVHVEKTGNSLPSPLSDWDHGKLSYLFNVLLSLSALPSTRQPFQSIIFHERAQFNIIRKMTEFEPALNITRKGYQAVAQVQLACRKTVPEREWARLKAKSWPPWKESKLGIDSDIDIDRGTSRASEVIMRSQEAGYAEQAWDSIAKVYAGWDTDNSPTIQTRAIVPRDNLSGQPSGSAVAVEDDPKLWQARITATRTLSEAWACFLAYRDQRNRSRGKNQPLPYFAMFEKIVFEEKKGHLNRMRLENKQSETLKGDEHDLLPGDGKETWPNPGPQKTVYTRTSAPSSHEFLNIMTEDRIVLGGRFLEFLMMHTTRLHQGSMHLAFSSLPLATRILFFNGVKTTNMCGVSDRVFAAYMACLCRHSLASRDMENYSQRSMSMSHAFQLMDKRKPSYWPPWNSLMSALRSEAAVVEPNLFGRNNLVQDAFAWSVMLYWLNQMRDVGLDLQFDCFQNLCIGLEKSTRASRKLVRLLDRGKFIDDDGLDLFTPIGQRLLEVLEHSTSDGVEKSILAGRELLRRIAPGDFRRPGELAQMHERLSWIRRRNLTRIRYNARYVVGNGPRILKACFEELVGFSEKSSPVVSPQPKGECNKADFNSLTRVPKLLAVPHPSNLHRFVRVLGLYQDYAGILRVVQWMDRFADEVHLRKTIAMNGDRMMRTMITAVRVFLEGRCTMDDDNDVVKGDLGQAGRAAEAARAEIVQQVFEIIDKQELWGGWPSDDEVAFYLSNARRNPDYSEDCRRFVGNCLEHDQQVRIKGFRKFYR